jgi:two-component system chemotaxis response regulator CheY
MPKLLLVNDNYSILQMLQDFLEENFEVSVAENGLEAYEAVRANPRHHFDVILLDINMPIMDGF